LDRANKVLQTQVVINADKQKSNAEMMKMGGLSMPQQLQEVFSCRNCKFKYHLLRMSRKGHIPNLKEKVKNCTATTLVILMALERKKLRSVYLKADLT